MCQKYVHNQCLIYSIDFFSVSETKYFLEVFHIKSLPGQGGIMSFELLKGFKCETSMWEELSFIGSSLTAIEKMAD